MSATVTVATVLLVVACTYAPTLLFPYVYEDRNDRAAFQMTTTDWIHDTFCGQVPPVGDAPSEWLCGVRQTLTDLRSRFLTVASFRATHALPLDAAQADHLGNVVVHLVNTALVMAIASPFGSVATLVAGLVFGLHPIQIEAVAYVSSRADLLVGAGLLLTLLGVTQGWRLVVLLGALVALASKETGVAALPLAWLWAQQLQRPLSRVVVTLAACVAGLGVLIIGTQLHWPIASPGEVGAHLAQLWRLLALVVVPVGFRIDHVWTWITPAVAVGAALAWLLVVGWAIERPSWIGFAGLWTLLAVAPRLLASNPEPLHEHHLYGPLIGLALATGVVVARLVPEEDLHG